MEALNFKVYPQDMEQIKAIKTIFKAFKIKFKVEEEKPYNTEFDINTGLTKKIFDWFLTTNSTRFIFFSSVKVEAENTCNNNSHYPAL